MGEISPFEIKTEVGQEDDGPLIKMNKVPKEEKDSKSHMLILLINLRTHSNINWFIKYNFDIICVNCF